MIRAILCREGADYRTFILLPIPTIWRLNMPFSLKCSAAGIFSLAAIIIAFDTVRAVKSNSGNTVFTLLYTSLEGEVAAMVAMLPAYRSIVSNKQPNKQRRMEFFYLITLRSIPSSEQGLILQSKDDSKPGSGFGEHRETQPEHEVDSFSGALEHGKSNIYPSE